LRAGIHGGRVVEQDGRYFGMALNLTARVTAHARAGQILCTEPIAASAHDLEDAKIHDVGLVRFKNVADPSGPVQPLDVQAGGRVPRRPTPSGDRRSVTRN
jgi:class 3 adenylate cyclase